MITKRDKRIELSPESAKAMYVGHLRLAANLAAKAAAKHRRQFNDVLDDAQSLLGEIISEWNSDDYSKRYNPAKCSPTSWIYRRLYWGLLTVCTRLQPRYQTFGTLAKDELPVDFAAPEPRWIDRLLNELGTDAKVLVTTIVDAPREIADAMLPNTKARARDAVRGYLQDKGWTIDKIDRAWSEVQLCLA